MEFVMGLCDQVTVLDSAPWWPPGRLGSSSGPTRRVLDAYLGAALDDDADPDGTDA